MLYDVTGPRTSHAGHVPGAEPHLSCPTPGSGSPCLWDSGGSPGQAPRPGSENLNLGSAGFWLSCWSKELARYLGGDGPAAPGPTGSSALAELMCPVLFSLQGTYTPRANLLPISEGSCGLD